MELVGEKEIRVEPLSFGMTGFKVEDLFSQDFLDELRRELPTSIVVHFCIGFTDSKEIVSISHDRREGKYVLERVDVEGSEADPIKHVVEVLKKVLA